MEAFQLILVIGLGLSVLSVASAYEIPDSSREFQRSKRDADTKMAEAYAIANVEAVAAAGSSEVLIREKRGSGGVFHIVQLARECANAAAAADDDSHAPLDHRCRVGCHCYGHSCWGGHGKK